MIFHAARIVALSTLAIAALSFAATSTANAQACEGYPSYRTHPVSFGTGVSRTGRWTSVDGGVSAGMAGVYGAVGGGYDRRDKNNPITPNLSVSDRYVAAHFGYEQPLGKEKHTIVCPTLGVVRIFGPDYDRPVSLQPNSATKPVQTRVMQYTYGVALGTIELREGPIRIIPSVQFAHVATRTHILFDGVPVNERLDFSDIQLELGVNFFNALTVQPWFNLAIGLEDASPAYGISIRYGFARSRAGR